MYNRAPNRAAHLAAALLLQEASQVLRTHEREDDPAWPRPLLLQITGCSAASPLPESR
jgi:hypothetical protein